jgi:small conductance mechanosensitive channel
MYLEVFKDINIITGDDISKWINGKGISLLDYLLKFLIALIVYVIVSKILKKVVKAISSRLDSRGVDPIASRFILNLIKYGIQVFIIVTIISKLHIVEITSIAALIASAGVRISLAMQGALSNFAGGVLLLVIRPFKKGDYIEIPNTNVEGVVEEIAIYYTTIKTVFGEVIKIPNSQLTNNSVKNRSGDDKRALVINVDVGYDTDIDKARAIVMELIKSEENIINGTENVFVDELGAHGVKLGIFGMVPVTSYIAVKRSLNEKILKVFRENDIEIPFNKLDVTLLNK